MDRWCSKVAVVTGASAGIGAAIAVDLVKHGLKVVGIARRKHRVEELQKELENAKGTLYPLEGDVSNEESILNCFSWVKNNFGTIHVLVNNAGIARPGKLVDGDPKHWREVFGVNVLGLSICTQQAFKLMKESGVNDGQIIHINSVGGHKVSYHPNPVMNVYPASKHAVTALTETLRQELRFMKTNIRIASISPGVVESEFTNVSLEGTGTSFSGELLNAYTSIDPLKPKDISEAVLYILSTPPHVQVHDIIMRPLGQAF